MLPIPLLRTPFPSVIDPALNVTVPVGSEDEAEVTVATNNNDWPNVEGLGLAFSDVIEEYWFTTCLNTWDVLPRLLASPEYCAQIDWFPEIVNAVLPLASPLTRGTVQRTAFPWFKVTLPVGALLPCVVTVV